MMVADLIVGFDRKVKHEAIPFIKKKVEKEGCVYYLDVAIIFGVSATTARNWFLELARKNSDRYFYDSGYLYLKHNTER